jgi:hypothetical protein
MTAGKALCDAALAEALVGAWRLVRWQIEYPPGDRVTYPFGPAPEGLLLYTADGHMSASMQRPARQRLSRANVGAVSDAEKAGAFDSCVQYAGRWRVIGADVHHDVEVAVNPNLPGTRQVRGAVLRGDELELRAVEALEAPGTARVHRILWRRARPREA